MDDTLVLHKGSTRAWIQINPSNPWASAVREITRSRLTDYTYEPRWKKYLINKRYLYYDEKTHKLFIPINTLPFIKDSLENIREQSKNVE